MKNAVSFLMALVFTGSAFANKTFETIEKKFDAGKIKEIQIEIGSANVDFTGLNVKQITAKVVRFEENKCILNIEPDNGRLFIELKSRKKINIFSDNSCKADIEIESPKNISYEIDGGSSDIKGANITEKVQVDIGSGDIDLVNISGGIYANAGSGNIEVANIFGGTVIKTGSGSIGMAKVTGDTKVSAGSGNITLAGVKGLIDLSTGSGNISGVVESADVTINTGSGNTRLSGLTGSLKHKSGSGSLTAVWKKPVVKGEVSLKKGSGDTGLCFPKGSKIDVDIDTGSGKVINKIGFLPEHKFFIHGSTGSGDITISYCK
jgi:hypothetical protein